jgi:hypothetical protein
VVYNTIVKTLMHLNYFLNITFKSGSLNLKLTFFRLHLVTKRPQSKRSRYQPVTWILVHHDLLMYLYFTLITWGMVFFFEGTILILFSHHNFISFETISTLQTKCTKNILFSPQLWFIYVKQKFNFNQSIWDKSVVLLWTYWGTHWELKKIKKFVVINNSSFDKTHWF